MSAKDILQAYKDGKIDINGAEKALRLDYLETIENDVVFDMSRELRKNIPEVVYAAPKTPETVASIAKNYTGGVLIISKATSAHMAAVKASVPNAMCDERSRTIIIGKMPDRDKGKIGIITAGNSDIPIAEEARIMAESIGVECITAYDVGIAGIHRVLDPMKKMIENDVDAIIVVAGMEGALPTFISSLSPAPIIGVPTSTGYGMGGNGEAALMCMLQTCSPGLSVVNIDNGIGAGSVAAMIAIRRKHNLK